jgi:hypothetical protein
MMTAARNPATAAPAAKPRTAGAARLAPLKTARWTETRAIAAMARSFA